MATSQYQAVHMDHAVVVKFIRGDIMPDLKTNMMFDAGFVKCHSTLELEITPYGDLALTSDDIELFNQNFLLYWGIPQGERLDPRIGCPWYDYQHKKSTGSNLAEFQNELKESLKWHFPGLGIKSLNLIYLDNHTIFGEMTVGSGKIQFLLDEQELMNLKNSIWDPFRELMGETNE